MTTFISPANRNSEIVFDTDQNYNQDNKVFNSQDYPKFNPSTSFTAEVNHFKPDSIGSIVNFASNNMFQNSKIYSSTHSSPSDHSVSSIFFKQFICTICQRSFSQKGNLKTHMKTHTGEKPFHCQICGKNFIQKGNLDIHMKIHTDERDNSCNFCTKRFTQKGNLKVHIQSVHSKEKPYACKNCGKTFSQKGNLQTHMRRHSDKLQDEHSFMINLPHQHSNYQIKSNSSNPVGMAITNCELNRSMFFSPPLTSTSTAPTWMALSNSLADKSISLSLASSLSSSSSLSPSSSSSSFSSSYSLDSLSIFSSF